MPLARTGRLLSAVFSAFILLTLSQPILAQESISLVGSGSNMAGSLYAAWTAHYNKSHPGVQVKYLPLGTSQSIREIHDGKGDFGGGEIPLTDAQRHGGAHALFQIPTILVAIVPVYNLPGNPKLRFSGELLAEIFLGEIKHWKDPRISRLNPGVDLPDLPITVVHLSGTKGTNYIFTDFLSKTSSSWKSRIGRTASPHWPVGVDIVRSAGLISRVNSTSGAISFVELGYATQKGVAYGSVQNSSGQFVSASNSTIAAACIASEKSIPDNWGASLTDAPGKDSHPIASFTWIYLPSSGLPPARSMPLKKFWNWALSDGQEIASSLGYTPLPTAIAAKARTTVDSMH